DDGDAVRILLGRDDFRGVLDPGAAPFGRREQDGLEADLGDEEPRRWADRFDALVDEAEVPVELLAAEALDRDDRAVLDELPGRGLLDLLLPPSRPVRLAR